MIDREKKLVSRHKVYSLKIWHMYVDPQFLHDNIFTWKIQIISYVSYYVS